MELSTDQVLSVKREAGDSRLLLVNVLGSLRKGGTEGAVSQISCLLRHLGYEVAIIALSGGDWEGYLRKNSVPTVILGRDARSIVNAPTVIWSLTRIFRRLRPDIVNGFLYPVSIWTSLAARLAGVRVTIASRRDCGFQRAEAPLPRWLETLSYRATRKFVANSVAVAESLHQQEGIDGSRTKVIYNGVDLPEIGSLERAILRQKFGFSESTLVVCMIANFWPHKNHLLLVQAAKQVVARLPQASFVLAGGYDLYQRHVEAEIHREGLGAYFRILGPINSASDILPAADLCVLCSQSEGFSNTILEYMAHGKPVIATRVGGNPEAVAHGETGCLIKADDSAELAATVLALATDPQRREAMGRRGRLRVESEFSWERSLKSWDELLRSLVPGERMRHGA